MTDTPRRIVVGTLPRDATGRAIHPDFVRMAAILALADARGSMKPKDEGGVIVPERVVPDYEVPERVVESVDRTPPGFRLTLVPREPEPPQDFATALRDALEAGDLVPVEVEACPHNRPPCKECGECPGCGCPGEHAPEGA